MALWTMEEIMRYTGSKLFQPDQRSRQWSTVCIERIEMDSRNVSSGCLFIALQGEHVDGHDFLPQVLQQKGEIILVEHLDKVPENAHKTAIILQVKDSFRALQDIGVAARSRMHGHLIGITGSFGKTTIKTTLAHVLQRQGPIHASYKSYNNHFGVPFTLANMPAATQFGVIEMGMSRQGELKKLTQQAKPTVALITNIGHAHSLYFDDIHHIAHAKSEIFEHLKDQGVAIVCGDQDEFLSILKAPLTSTQTLFTYGKSAHCDYQLISCTPLHPLKQKCHVRLRDKTYQYHCPFVGEDWALNTVAALAVVENVKGDLQHALQDLETFPLMSGRGARVTLRLHSKNKTIHIIDQSYNANPETMVCALKQFAQQKTTGRRIAVLGDMMELSNPEQMHAALYDVLATLPIDWVCTSGPLMRHLWMCLPQRQRMLHHDDPYALGQDLARFLHDGDILLLKGSKGRRAETGRMADVMKALV